MIARALSLRNFRNYAKLDVEFCDGLNILRGDNAQGKTNVLEALFACAAGRSHRTPRDQEMVRHGERSAEIVASFWRQEAGMTEIMIAIERGGGKSICVNGVPLRRLGELMGRFPAVMFSPEDLGIIKDEPQARRRFLDMFISQIRPSYFFDLHQYNKALRQRNAFLRSVREKGGFCAGGENRRDELLAWDSQLARLGARVSFERMSFAARIAEQAREHALCFTGGKERMVFEYAPSVKVFPGEERIEIEARIAKALAESHDADVARSSTQHGPHKDDLSSSLGGKPMRQFGSQGQQRTAALALKMAQVDIMTEELGETPALLLDDVMSELDPGRQANLASHAINAQTFITGASDDAADGLDMSVADSAGGMAGAACAVSMAGAGKADAATEGTRAIGNAYAAGETHADSEGSGTRQVAVFRVFGGAVTLERRNTPAPHCRM